MIHMIYPEIKPFNTKLTCFADGAWLSFQNANASQSEHKTYRKLRLTVWCFPDTDAALVITLDEIYKSRESLWSAAFSDNLLSQDMFIHIKQIGKYIAFIRQNALISSCLGRKSTRLDGYTWYC